MADLTLNTTSAQYQKLLTAQQAIAEEVRPRLRMVKLLMERGERGERGERDKARRLIDRDLLLKRELRKAKAFRDFVGDDL